MTQFDKVQESYSRMHRNGVSRTEAKFGLCLLVSCAISATILWSIFK